MEKKTEEGLLKKKYYEKCEGCEVEKLKATNHGVPVKYLLYVGIVVLSAGM
ncbi:hypothetical protein Patl1_21020 [Pistacia atlantica]|uniref:Uncharacterized protein n=1 Tax=Pistacia atlantica TaxID=434234 RepID=A0ACC1BHC3_9ROSI|nr:hypothetical protein Patl1_21020 [Pistacia atlantica]